MTGAMLRVLAFVLASGCAVLARAAAVDDAMLSGAAATGDWPGYGRLFDQQRFSPLEEINTASIARLGLVSSLELPDVPGTSTAPLEHAGVLYFAAGYSVVYAVEAVSGRLLWKYDPKVTGPKMRMAWGSRGLALLGQRLYVGTQDGRLVALAADSGRLAWQVQTTRPGDVRYITGPPLVFGDTVVIGQGGSDFGATRGYVTAYDARTGRQRWRFYLVPGDPAKGFENSAMRMAAATWTGRWWRFGGGGTVWNAMTYDPAFDRIYLGTGNGAPWNRKIRSPGGGDNLFLSCIVALDARTGHYVWHYQTTPGDTWDFDAAQDMVLATLEIGGTARKVLLQAPKNGFFYVIDREDGRLISAEKFAKVTWAERVDSVTGRPVEAAHARYEGGEALLWPGTLGAHGWQPMSYDPDTGLAYVPGRDIPGYYNDRGIDPQTWQMGRDGSMGVNVVASDAPVGAGEGWLLAWDPARQAAAWRVPLPGISAGGTLATRGGLVFQANASGNLVAYDARSGATLWRFDMGVGGNAPPITYRAAGRQYVSVLAGWTGQAMMLGSLSAQHGWVGREHPRRLLTFALDGRASLPAAPAPARPAVLKDPPASLDPAQVARGQALFNQCLMCHGLSAVAGGYAPDLRASPVARSAAAFRAIVREGSLESRGMPRFGEFSDQNLEDLRVFVQSRARAAADSSPGN
ncbi:MAG: PQQ-dependent dehydrogenase, methanol/ethanol family [Proteobacteria bacterium]|nr:PQQ-dependent dehydrogenase, methanol/ethanol family [Pseudomonadota bacterium]